MKNVRVGIVGAAFGGLFAPIYHEHPYSEILGICDINEALASNVGIQVGAKYIFNDFDDMLRCRDLDAIHIATPAPLHAGQAVKALRAGKHVLSAVPAALTIDECYELADTVESTGLKYMMAETSNYYPEVLHAKRLIESGEFGDVIYCESDYIHVDEQLWSNAEDKPTWRMGYPPMLYPTHCTGPIILLNRAYMTTVSCFASGNMPTYAAEKYNMPYSHETALFKLANGTVAKVTLCFAEMVRQGTVRFSFYGSRMSMESADIHGAKHRIFHSGEECDLVEFLPMVDELPPEIRHHTEHEGSHPHLIHGWIMSIVNDTRPPIDVHDSIAYTLPGICAHQSALKDGEVINIPAV